jgi:hypothetical protein
MARVVVRVELHGATTEQQYERLHTRMASAGFSRTITAGNGGQYWLPTATYSSDRYGSETLARDAAWAASAGITSSYAVIATCGNSAWNGLAEVRSTAHR